MKRGTRLKIQMKSLNEYRAKHPKEKELDINVELDKVKKQVQECNKCGLCELKENKIESGECFGKLVLTPLHRTMFNKTILFVGQSPSHRRFDLDLRAFKGVDAEATLEDFKTSDDLFRLCLEQSEIKDYNLWVDNIVHCSTTDNQRPSNEQINACLPWLLEEIELLNPSLIVCLGNTVFENVKEKLKDYKLAKIWHPAACMYKGKESIQEFIQQLNNLKKLI